MADLHIKPAPGLRVIDPATRQPLPAEGATVQGTTYWHRRLAEGDVVEIQADSTAVQTPAKPTSRSKT